MTLPEASSSTSDRYGSRSGSVARVQCVMSLVTPVLDRSSCPGGVVSADALPGFVCVSVVVDELEQPTSSVKAILVMMIVADFFTVAPKMGKDSLRPA